MPEHFLEKAKQISDLYQEIELNKKVLKNLTEYKHFVVPSLGSSYKVIDPSIVEVTIKAYCVLLDQKVDKLYELINGEYNKVMSNLSAIVNEKQE